MNRDDLTKALRKASAAARAAQGTDDGGSCNLDSPVLTIPRMRESTAQFISDDSGVRIEKMSGRSGQWWVRTPTAGQAGMRTRMVEAAAKSLKADGFDCYVWYHAD